MGWRRSKESQRAGGGDNTSEKKKGQSGPGPSLEKVRWGYRFLLTRGGSPFEVHLKRDATNRYPQGKTNLSKFLKKP